MGVRAGHVALCVWMFSAAFGVSAQSNRVWTAEKANGWYAKQPVPIGANFLPSTAINQLEMWQEETFDPKTIDRELGWAAGIGMNTMRVYLHDLAWKSDSLGFKRRMGEFLRISHRHGMRIVFVFFDDCWNPDARTGPQPQPKPGVHNSGWVRSPSRTVHDDPLQWGYLERYVKDVLRTFSGDMRILMWDLYNEPGNSGYGQTSMPLLRKVFEWAWAIRPTQPLTCGIWFDDKTFNDFQTASSDVITFHNYADLASMQRDIDERWKSGRPVICTEYMARTRGSRFETHLPYMVERRVGAINWGLVAGKSNTVYAWDTPIPDGSEPDPWFHDVFRKDGTPYRVSEVDAIRKAAAVNGKR